jgi:hypothetical protein
VVLNDIAEQDSSISLAFFRVELDGAEDFIQINRRYVWPPLDGDTLSIGIPPHDISMIEIKCAGIVECSSESGLS